MIRISLNNILQMVPVLQELAQSNFKGSLSFKIGRLIRELDKELTLFEEERQKVIRKYSEKDEDGNIVFLEAEQVKINDIEKCNEELQILLETVIEINADKLPVEAFEEIAISPLQANILDTIVE